MLLLSVVQGALGQSGFILCIYYVLKNTYHHLSSTKSRYILNKRISIGYVCTVSRASVFTFFPGNYGTRRKISEKNIFIFIWFDIDIIKIDILTLPSLECFIHCLYTESFNI